MTMTIPTLPVMPAGYVAQEADMNNLAYCCTFLLTKPVVRVHDSLGTAAIAAAFAVIPFNTKDYDTDGMWSTGANTQLTVQTPGWFKLSYSVIMSDASGRVYNTYVRSTYGANNPNTGQSQPYWAGYAFGSTGFASCGSSGVWPEYLYQGDFLQVYAQTNATGPTLDVSQCNSSFEMEYVSI